MVWRIFLFQIVILLASACPVYPVERLEEKNIVKRQTILNSRERESLIGHLQGLEGRTLVLTQRQKLALRQELALREEGFGAFSPASDKEENVGVRTKQHTELPRHSQLFANKDFENSQDQFQTNFRSRSRFSPENKSSTTANQHPEVLLNQLQPAQKLVFQAQFNKLSQDLQEFSYNKFLSSSPDIQSYAIQQFLSLTPQQLTQSIKSEKNKEKERLFQQRKQSFSPAKDPQLISQSPSSTFTRNKQLKSDFVPSFAPKHQTSQFDQARQKISPVVQKPRFIDQPSSPMITRKESARSLPPQNLPSQVEKELQLFQEEASKADQLALQQQVEALKDIIAQQNKINFSK